MSWIETASQVLSNSWAFVKRHKKKFIVGGAAVALVGGYYWWKKKAEAAQLEHQKKVPFIKRMKHFFTKNKEAANDALRKMLPEIRAALQQLMDLEQLVSQLKDRNSLTGDESKVIWERLKIESITRMITALYSASLVNIFFNLQLNLIGRVLFQGFLAEERQRENATMQQQQIAEEGKKDSSDDEDSLLPQAVQRQFFAYAFHFQSNGMKILADRVKHHVTTHFANVSLKSQRFTARQLCELLSNVCHDLELEFEQEAKQIQNSTATTTTATLCSILLPSDNQPEHPPIVHELLNELRDLLESEQIVHVLHDTTVQLFQVMFAHVDKMVTNGHRKLLVKESSSSTSSSSSLNGGTSESQQEEMSLMTTAVRQQQAEEAPSTYLGHIISRIVQESKFLLSENQENDYVRALQNAAALNNFCGMVYTNGIDI